MPNVNPDDEETLAFAVEGEELDDDPGDAEPVDDLDAAGAPLAGDPWRDWQLPPLDPAFVAESTRLARRGAALADAITALRDRLGGWDTGTYSEDLHIMNEAGHDLAAAARTLLALIDADLERTPRP
jgi:hypothetical protein